MIKQLTAHVWVGDGDGGSCVAWRDTTTSAFVTPTFLGEEIGAELAQALLSERQEVARLREAMRKVKDWLPVGYAFNVLQEALREEGGGDD